MIFFVIFLIIPLTEIGIFMAVGDEIGIINTLFLCVLTAMVGAAMIRHQGLHTLFSARQHLDQNRMPLQELFDGLCLVIAGLMLMTPGFFTDTIGFSLLVPPVRQLLRKSLSQHINAGQFKQSTEAHYETHEEYNNIIEGDFEQIDDDKNKDE